MRVVKFKVIFVCPLIAHEVMENKNFGHLDFNMIDLVKERKM
jgi:hypothetical protein